MKNILIADDNKDITDILAAYVKKEGYHPVIAKDGGEAERLFESENPVALLLDVMMPGSKMVMKCVRIFAKDLAFLLF